MQYPELAPYFFVRMLITNEELNRCKCKEQIPLECEVCGNVFHKSKSHVLRGIKGTRRISVCSEKCRRVSISKSLKDNYTNPSFKPSKRNAFKKELVRLTGGKCVLCGYDRCITSLEFHHKNPNTKSFSISSGLSKKYPINELIEEIKKCILICSNCHGEINEGLTKIKDDVE